MYVGDADVLYEQPHGERVGTVEDVVGNVWVIAQPAEDDTPR